MVCQIFLHFFFQLLPVLLCQASAHIVEGSKTAHPCVCRGSVVGKPSFFRLFLPSAPFS